MSGEIRNGTFQWTVDRFLERKGEKKESKLFKIWNDNCYLFIPSRDGSGSIISQYYTLYLEAFHNSKCIIDRSLKLCLIGPNGEEILAINRRRLLRFSDVSFLLMTIRDKELREDAELLPGGSLTVRLSWYEETDEKRPMEMLETLSRDLSHFYIGNANTECVLKVGDTEIPAHRGILSARSEVFGEMFRHETAEHLTGVVDILDADVIRDFLKYIYSGKVHGLTTCTAAPLFIVAKKYGLRLLQEACLSFLMDNLTYGNVCDAATVADTYGEKELENKVVQFIGDGMVDVQGTAEWKKFTRNKHPLAIKLLTSVIAYKDTKKETS